MNDSSAITLQQNSISTQPRYTEEQIKTIKNTVAKGSTDDELKMFIGIAEKYGLDPFIKEIWFIKRPKKINVGGNKWDYPRTKTGEIDYTGAETIIMTSRDGYLKIAQRDSDFDGIIGFPVREGDTFEVDAENYTVVHKFGMKRGKIIGAWAKVQHKKRKPVIVWADFTEYNSPSSNVWKQYPSAMIQKVAETLALKRQFGISGLTTKEEMATAYDEYEASQVTEVKEPKGNTTKPQQEPSGSDTPPKQHMAEKEQKEAIFDMAKALGLATGKGKSAKFDALKQFCMKTVDKPLEHITYEDANVLLEALANYSKEEESIPTVQAEIVESQNTLTPEEQEAINAFAAVESN